MNTPDTRLYLMARIHLKPEHYDEGKAALAAIVPPTLEEAGADRFRLHEGVEEGRKILYLYETFRDQEALDDHYAQSYTQAIFTRYEQWLAEPVQATKMRHVIG